MQQIENQVVNKSTPTSTYPIHNKNLSAIIPAYNEALSIGSLVLQTKKYVDQIIVIDDGSKDKTADIARLAGATVIQLDKNQGKAQALMYGFELLKQTGCTAAVMFDGDGQHNPDDIPAVVDPVLRGEADLVIGSRYLGKESAIPAYRMLGQKTLGAFTNFGSQTKTTDSTSGFRALSSTAMENLDFKSDGYSIEFDMINHFASRNLQIAEVPIEVSYGNPNFHKKNAFTQGLGPLYDLIGTIGYKRPMVVFVFTGAFIAFFGVIAGYMVFPEQFPFILTMLSGITILLGFLLISSGLLLNSLVQIMKTYKK
ncbi:glycosyltransferase family 2 protein [Methanogenium sp. S4BF]|uniref:glycosyltransferase family 2 protein n=1 Tax=Methanogenium sp. S4BF TaxID=1789226 RepID=UPI002416D8F3|nr:glycosyltransferase family 2 protein [Methanogenium sp. S4BF]WFN35317.1 glycosyltransferase family 2 protein [Methanogenium sp. S4BF]